MEHYVKDIRSGNQQGPFPKDAAERYAADLNDFVKRNANITRQVFVVVAASRTS